VSRATGAEDVVEADGKADPKAMFAEGTTVDRAATDGETGGEGAGSAHEDKPRSSPTAIARIAVGLDSAQRIARANMGRSTGWLDRRAGLTPGSLVSMRDDPPAGPGSPA
jgi:hypothetical protein